MIPIISIVTKIQKLSYATFNQISLAKVRVDYALPKNAVAFQITE